MNPEIDIILKDIKYPPIKIKQSTSWIWQDRDPDYNPIKLNSLERAVIRAEANGLSDMVEVFIKLGANMEKCCEYTRFEDTKPPYN